MNLIKKCSLSEKVGGRGSNAQSFRSNLLGFQLYKFNEGDLIGFMFNVNFATLLCKFKGIWPALIVKK